MSGNRRSTPAGGAMLDAMTRAGNVDVRDHERCYRAVSGRDARFDGWFFTAVHTTGIYCRPSCPARTPLARNVTFFTTAAAAQAAGFRARRPGQDGAPPGWLTLRLTARAPYDAAEVLLFLGAHAVPGLEEWDGTTFSRVLDLPHGPAVVQLSPAADGGPAVTARLRPAS